MFTRERPMPRAGYTEAPCDGCGEGGGREKGKLCRSCQDLIKEARAARDRQAAITDRVLYRIPSSDHGLSAYYIRQQSTSGARDQSSRNRVRDLLMQLTTLIGEPRSGPPNHAHAPPALYDRTTGPNQSDRDGMSSWYARDLWMTPELAMALNMLDQAIETALIQTFAAGVDMGSSLIGQLASGAISAEDFNKKVVLGDSRATVTRKEFKE
jgi:hypothetical protein